MFDGAFFVNIFVVYPLVRKILSSKSLSKNKQVIAAIFFLAAIGIFSLIYEFYDTWGENYFQILGVSHDATVGEIKKAYKEAALRLHPDKNKNNPNAESMFIAVKEAYNVLLNDEQRMVYDRWGKEMLKQLESEDISAIRFTGIIQAVVYYVTWSALVFLLTIQSSDTNARSWSYAGLALVAAMDLGMRFGNLDIPTPLFSYLTIKEKVFIIQQLYPSFMHGCNVIQGAIYVNLKQVHFELLRGVIKQNNVILLRLNQLEKELANSKVVKNAKTAILENTEDTTNSNQNMPNPEQMAPPPKSGKIPGWLYMLGLYILFNYVLKSG